MLLLFGIFESFFVIITSERVKGKTTPDQLTLNLFSLKSNPPDLVLSLKTKSGYKEAMSVSSVIAIGCLLIVLLIFTTPLAF